MTSSKRNRRGREVRRGFTLVEVGVALVMVAVAMLLVMQLSLLSLRERIRRNAQQVALEVAVNVLETARAQPWQSLTPEWAAEQQIPDGLSAQLPDSKLIVSVEPATELSTKRITVEIRGRLTDEVDVELARLVGLFSARSTPMAGGEK